MNKNLDGLIYLLLRTGKTDFSECKMKIIKDEERIVLGVDFSSQKIKVKNFLRSVYFDLIFPILLKSHRLKN